MPLAARVDDVVVEDPAVDDRAHQGDGGGGDHAEDHEGDLPLVGHEEFEQPADDGVLVLAVGADLAVLILVDVAAFRAFRVELLEDLVVVPDIVAAQEPLDELAEREETLAGRVGALRLDLGDGVFVPRLVDLVLFLALEVFVDFGAGRFVRQDEQTRRGEAGVDVQIGGVVHRKAVEVGDGRCVFGLSVVVEVGVAVFLLFAGNGVGIAEEAVDRAGVLFIHQPRFAEVSVEIQIHPHGEGEGFRGEPPVPHRRRGRIRKFVKRKHKLFHAFLALSAVHPGDRFSESNGKGPSGVGKW